MDLTFTLKEVIALGGVCSSLGGLGVWSLVHGRNITTLQNDKQDKEGAEVHEKNITALWNQKQDKNVCEPVHTDIKEDIGEIKADVKTLLRQNGGGK